MGWQIEQPGPGTGYAARLRAAQLAGEARGVDVGDASPARLRRRPDGDEGAGDGDRAADPDPDHERVDVHPEVGRRGVAEVVARDGADRHALEVGELGLSAPVARRHALA